MMLDGRRDLDHKRPRSVSLPSPMARVGCDTGVTMNVMYSPKDERRNERKIMATNEKSVRRAAAASGSTAAEIKDPLTVELRRASERLDALENKSPLPTAPSAAAWQAPFAEHMKRARDALLMRMARDAYLAERAAAQTQRPDKAVLRSERRVSIDEARAWISSHLRSTSKLSTGRRGQKGDGTEVVIPWRTHSARSAAQAALAAFSQERRQQEPLLAVTAALPHWSSSTHESRLAVAATMMHSSRNAATASLALSPAIGSQSQGRERVAASARSRAAATRTEQVLELVLSEHGVDSDEREMLSPRERISPREIREMGGGTEATAEQGEPAEAAASEALLASSFATAAHAIMNASASSSEEAGSAAGSVTDSVDTSRTYSAAGPFATGPIMTTPSTATPSRVAIEQAPGAEILFADTYTKAPKGCRIHSTTPQAATADGNSHKTQMSAADLYAAASRRAVLAQRAFAHGHWQQLRREEAARHAAIEAFDDAVSRAAAGGTASHRRTCSASALVHTLEGAVLGTGIGCKSADNMTPHDHAKRPHDVAEVQRTGAFSICGLCARRLESGLLHSKPVSSSAVWRQRTAWGAPPAEACFEDILARSYVRVCKPCFEVIRGGRGSADSRRSSDSAAAGGEGWIRTLHRTERARLSWPWEPAVPRVADPRPAAA